jgi:DNA-binding transcriptional MerR regulator
MKKADFIKDFVEKSIYKNEYSMLNSVKYIKDNMFNGFSLMECKQLIDQASDKKSFNTEERMMEVANKLYDLNKNVIRKYKPGEPNIKTEIVFKKLVSCARCFPNTPCVLNECHREGCVGIVVGTRTEKITTKRYKDDEQVPLANFNTDELKKEIQG